MSILGIEEIFLAVKNMEKSIAFYNGILGIPIDKQDSERTYLQTERGHIVLQIINHTGRHNGGGPLHFAFTVTEDSFDEISEMFNGGMYSTWGPYGEKGKGRALFIIDPDGNETEIFSFLMLEKAFSSSVLPSEREHVTPYFRNQKESFKIKNFTNDKDISNLRWTLDYEVDLKLIIYYSLYANVNLL